LKNPEFRKNAMSTGTHVSIDELISLKRQAAVLAVPPQRKILSSQAGGYRAPFRGRGMEFDETRIYQPGDDVRTIDWRVTARSGLTHTKLFREERERPVFLLVDMSYSMRFGTRVAFKSVIAARAAALLAWSCADNGDRIGALLFDDDRHQDLRPTRGRRGVLALLNALSTFSSSNSTPGAASSVPWIEGLQRATSITKPGSLIFLLSDFDQPSARAEQLLSQLQRHNEVVAVFIHDPLESALPPPDRYTISDGRQFCSLDTSDAALVEAYQSRFENRQRMLYRICTRQRVRVIPLSTAQPVARTLALGLKTRVSRKPVNGPGSGAEVSHGNA
jgi:uncharacterized protein (DUF58 family)